MSRPLTLNNKTAAGILICQKLKEQGKTQKELSKEIGKNSHYIHYLCKGKYIPTLQTLNDISIALDISKESLSNVFIDEINNQKVR